MNFLYYLPMAPEIQNPAEVELAALLKEIPPLIDRLNQEYNKFFSGAERKAPAPLRAQVNAKVERLRQSAQQVKSASGRFRAQNMVAQYSSRTAIWDKKLREREATGSR